MYYFLLILTAVFSYAIGSLSSLTISSMYVFRKNLRKLGKGNVWLSNFRRVYGTGGLLLLLLVEVVRDLIPIFIGGLLLLGKEHSDVGRMFAGFCLVMGRLWPIFYDLKGSHATICLIVTAFFADPAVGTATAVTAAAVLFLSKYFALATIAAAVVAAVTAILTVDMNLVMYLMCITSGVVIIKHIPAVKRILAGTENKLSLETDLGYKFDQ